MPTQNSLTVAKFIKLGFIHDGPPTHVAGLLPGVMFRDVSVGESFNVARIFRNEFLQSKRDYPTENFRALGWIHARHKDWWALLTVFELTEFERELVDIGLLGVIRATQYGIATNLAQLFAILKVYNPATGTFFYPR